jgi:presequence protease
VKFYQTEARMKDYGFELLRRENVAEYNTEARLYRHRSGARLLSMVNDDENKVFGANFCTPPADSTGIAHIMEHSVLCGSRKYPVKEPFVELLKGSLKTFLNAFTYPDKTCYPVASQNVQDFYNLVDVYLDAVFFPRLTPQVLQQEGWHYEPTADGGLEYKGVVYNEMKGAYSSPDSVAMQKAQLALFPDNAYGVDSGGDPRHIPDLTWDDFSAFHSRYYHPANALLYFYGDDDPEKRLEMLDAYLSQFEPRETDAVVDLQPRFDAPRHQEHTYAAGEGGEAKSIVTVNWLLEDGIGVEEGLGLEVLEHVLIGTSASPLRKRLIESGLGEELSGYGMESEMRQMSFSTGLKGVEIGRESEAEALVLDTLRQLAAEGLDSETVRASLNTFEFRLRENNSGSYPRGLLLMLRSLSTWLYGGDPLEPLRFEAPLKGVGQQAAGGGYFEELIRRHLLDNNHRVTVQLRPDAELAAREEAEEKGRLAAAAAAMSPAQLEEVAQQAAQLQAQQEEPDDPADLAKLPALNLADLERKPRQVPSELSRVGDAELLYHDLPTNGIAYVDAGFDLGSLGQEYLSLMPLFGRALLEMGTEKEDFVQLAQRIGSRTGGVWTQTLVMSHRSTPQPVSRFFLRGKAMAGRIDELFDIWRDVLLTARFDDRDRFLQMALEERAGEEAGLVPGGHAVVSLRLRARFDKAAWVSEQMEGVSYLFYLRRLIDEIRDDWPKVLGRLEKMRATLVNRVGTVCNATLAAADRPVFDRALASFVDSLPAAASTAQQWGGPGGAAGPEGLALPAQVNYVGKGASLFDLGYKMHGSVGVISRFMRNTWLWDRVRVQGGAYGAMCGFEPFSGTWTYASYRDPNLAETLAVYDGAGGFLRQANLDKEELSKAIIGAVGDMDSYQLPDAKGYTALVRHLAGVDEEYRQQRRDEILGTTATDFRNFAAVLDAVAEQGQVVILGGAEALAQERENLGLDIIKVL